jgi:hypothetical protein
LFVGQEDERTLRAIGPGRFEQVEGAHRVDLEVVERPAGGEVVGRLCRGVHDQAGARLRDQVGDERAIADVEVVVVDAHGHSLESLQVPGRVAVLPEEVTPQVVVDPVHRVAAGIQERRPSRSRSNRSTP